MAATANFLTPEFIVAVLTIAMVELDAQIYNVQHVMLESK